MLQRRVTTNAGVLVSTLPHVSCCISNSVWATRGWTYQEAYLSKRCLFFTNYQVYFACRSGTKSEAVFHSYIDNKGAIVNTHNRRDGLQPQHFSVKQMLRETFDGYTWLRHIWTDIVEYNKRNLSFAEDALDAFRGMLKASSFYSYWGIPFGPRLCQDTQADFICGLAWRCQASATRTSTLSRRNGFPTWSWLSVTGELDGRDYFQTTRDCRDPSRSSTSILVEGTSGRLVPVTDLLESGDSNIIPEQTRYLHVTGNFIRVRLCKAPGESLASQLFSLCCPNCEHQLGQPTPQAHYEKCRMKAVLDAPLDDCLDQATENICCYALELLTFFDGSYAWLLFILRGNIAYRIGLTFKHWKEKKYCHFSEKDEVRPCGCPVYTSEERKTFRLG
jgi:hypothetical protein